MFAPIAQDQHYHRFADARALAGLDNAADVLSSLAFVAVGLLGLRAAPPAYRLFFIAVVLTGLGSAYYHLAPGDARLVWDRLPIALAAVSLLAAVVAERVGEEAGGRLLIPLLALGAGSVLYWSVFDDLRLYGVAQFGSIAAALGVVWAHPSRAPGTPAFFAAAGLYGVAKLLESHDREVYELTAHAISGHTLKHLIAAAALYLIAARRRAP